MTYTGDDNETLVACKHYANSSMVTQQIRKYFHQRYTLFSKYDEGVWMIDDAWFGVTPEPVANKVAHHVAQNAPGSKAVLIDCFAGVGGNTIAFALSGRWKRVYAIEKDLGALTCAKHNAKIYGVDQQISWYSGDCFQILKAELAPLGQYSVVFASPPWGGPGYSSDAVFDLTTMQPYSLDYMLQAFRLLSQTIALFLPRTSNLQQLASGNNEDIRVQAIHYCIEGASKVPLTIHGKYCDFAKLSG